MNPSPQCRSFSLPKELLGAALFLLYEQDAQRKAAGVHVLSQAWRRGDMQLQADAVLSAMQAIPGRPPVRCWCRHGR